MSTATVYDLSAVPTAELYAEIGRRRAVLRTSYTGGAVWAKHNPNTTRCRCAACNERRKAAQTAKGQTK